MGSKLVDVPGFGIVEFPESMTDDDISMEIAKSTTPPVRFVMCPPMYLSTDIANNVLMKGEKVDTQRAVAQYFRARHLIEAFDVDVLEIPPVPGNQDQTYTANVGVSIGQQIVLANYKAPGRSGEVGPARRFFESIGRQCVQPPTFFEGEADFKRLNDRTYFGGWGPFTERSSLDWIGNQTGVEVIPVHETDATLYHLDCSLLVIDEQNALVTVDAIDKESLRAIEQRVNVIPTPPAPGKNTTATTTCVLIPEKRICLSGAFNAERDDYTKMMEWLNQTFDSFGYTCVFLDIDEAAKSGADLSCMVMHLTGESTE